VTKQKKSAANDGYKGLGFRVLNHLLMESESS